MDIIENRKGWDVGGRTYPTAVAAMNAAVAAGLAVTALHWRPCSTTGKIVVSMMEKLCRK